jgi:hypothetical protein
MDKHLEIDGEKICYETLNRTIDTGRALIDVLPMKYSIFLHTVSLESKTSYDYGRLAITELEDAGIIRFSEVNQMEYLVK